MSSREPLHVIMDRRFGRLEPNTPGQRGSTPTALNGSAPRLVTARWRVGPRSIAALPRGAGWSAS